MCKKQLPKVVQDSLLAVFRDAGTVVAADSVYHRGLRDGTAEEQAANEEELFADLVRLANTIKRCRLTLEQHVPHLLTT